MMSKQQGNEQSSSSEIDSPDKKEKESKQSVYQTEYIKYENTCKILLKELNKIRKDPKSYIPQLKNCKIDCFRKSEINETI